MYQLPSTLMQWDLRLLKTQTMHRRSLWRQDAMRRWAALGRCNFEGTVRPPQLDCDPRQRA